MQDVTGFVKLQNVSCGAIFAALKNDFGSNLRRLRRDKFSRSKDLAAALNVTPNIVSRWETARTGPPGADTLIRLAKLIGCSVDALLDGVDGYARRDLTDHARDLESGQPQDAGVAHDPVAASKELQRLRDVIEQYEKETREVRTVSDALAKVVFTIEEIRKTGSGSSSRGRRHRKVD